MQLFEIIRWGNDSDDPVTGGPDGPDTCFLVSRGVAAGRRPGTRRLDARPDP